MPASPEAVLKSLKANEYAPVYLLQGAEPFYIDLITQHIEANALPEAQKGFNQMVLYGKDVDVATVLNNARRFPMMSDRQVVIVKEAQEIADLNREEGQKRMLDYLQNPTPSTILVLAHKHKTLDGRKPLAKAADKYAVLVTTKKLYDNQVPEWVRNYVKGKGHSIDDKATQMLADYIGTNLERLANEIDKILINFAQPGTIDPGLVQKYVGISKEFNVFELQKAIAIRDVLKANRIVQYFEANPKNNPAIPVIAVLFGFFSRLLLVHQSKDSNDKALAGLLRLSPFVVKEYRAAARNYHVFKVMENVNHLRQADLRAKGVGAGSTPEGQLLKELVYRLMH